MLESIKESDRYSYEGRKKVAVLGMIVTIGGALACYAFGIDIGGSASGWAIVFLLLGLSIVFWAIFAEFKGNIDMNPHCAITPRRVCPACMTRGQMERYNLKTGTSTERQYRVIYTNVKTTTHWACMAHCRSCGYKGSTNVYGMPLRAGAGAAGASNGADSENDPLAKARAIIEAAKKKRLPVVIGNIVYAKVALDDATDTTTDYGSEIVAEAELMDDCDNDDDDDDDPLRMIV